jgi:hypothetical protein
VGDSGQGSVLGEAVTHADPLGAIAFAERVLDLLEDGRFTATYKYAVLLGIMDVCLETTKVSGAPPDTVTTRQLAEKVVELYWPHTVEFIATGRSVLLKQNTLGQAEIVRDIGDFRARHAPDPTATHWQSQQAAPRAYEALVRRVEWKLIEMPLPRLHTVGPSSASFVYDIGWDTAVERAHVAPYLAGRGGFDNRIMLRPGVGDYFLQLNGLLRPLIQRRWAAMVAQLNRLEESQLEVFLFGSDRTATGKLRAGLWDLQEGRCFYCEARIADPLRADVDHFIPWSRYPDDSLDNLVVADRACNGFKSNSLAATNHVLKWRGRLIGGSSAGDALADLAEHTGWLRNGDAVLSVARAIYFKLPADARLWWRKRDYVAPEPGVLIEALGNPCGESG